MTKARKVANRLSDNLGSTSCEDMKTRKQRKKKIVSQTDSDTDSRSNASSLPPDLPPEISDIDVGTFDIASLPIFLEDNNNTNINSVASSVTNVFSPSDRGILCIYY